jgi:hypothetical protein
LPDELPRGADDKDQRLGLIRAFKTSFRLGSFEFQSFAEKFGEDWYKKCRCLPGAYIKY